MLQSMGLQRVRHDLVTEQQQSCLLGYSILWIGLYLSLFLILAPDKVSYTTEKYQILNCVEVVTLLLKPNMAAKYILEDRNQVGVETDPVLLPYSKWLIAPLQAW